MKELHVKMLGRFDILLDGNSILSTLGKSSKSLLLLKYFLLNKERSISVSNIIDVFWSEPDKSTNPDSAMKTMVSRVRNSLGKAEPALKNCILSEKKSYRWNPEIPCTVDVGLFEQLHQELQKEETFNEEVRQKYMKLLDLYAGDLTYSDSDEDWIITRSLYLHHLYLKSVYRMIQFLKQEQDYETIIHVCRVALDIDTFDETLNIELMDALRAIGQNSSVMLQYRHITSAYSKYLGIEPSEKMTEFYRDLMKSGLAEAADIDIIKRQLKSAEDANNGAFICDYSVFRDIYQLQMRNLERQKNKMYLSLISVVHPLSSEPMDPLLLDEVMRELMDILKICLRKGDTISRYSPSQYAVLLPMMSFADGNIVMNRIKKMFYQRQIYPNINLSFQLGSME